MAAITIPPLVQFSVTYASQEVASFELSHMHVYAYGMFITRLIFFLLDKFYKRRFSLEFCSINDTPKIHKILLYKIPYLVELENRGEDISLLYGKLGSISRNM